VDIDVADLSHAAKVARALSNPIRLKLWRVVLDRPATLTQICDRMQESHYRESIYRHLESLVKAGILDKVYSKQEGAIQYRAVETSIVFDTARPRRGT
jgi:Fe2+ or Zn2+ uptake regulation protein